MFKSYKSKDTLSFKKKLYHVPNSDDSENENDFI